MDNIKALLGYLNNICKSIEKGGGCESCPNYAECDHEVWEAAQAELDRLGIDIEVY